MPSSRSTRRGDRRAKEEPTRAKLEDEEMDVDEEVEMEVEAVADEEEDEDEDEEAETRCVCEQIDPPDESGLYIQCETCSVWQHGYCVGITKKVPEKYWCEQCKPELHVLTVTGSERKSTYLPVQQQKKKRTKPSGHQEQDHESSTTKSRRERATQDARYEAMIKRVMEESKKDVKDEDSKSTSASRSSRSSRRRKDETPSPPASASSHNNNDNNSQQRDDDTPEAEDEDEGEETESKSETKKRESSRKAEDTPQPEKKKKRQTKPKEKKEKQDSSIDFNKPTKPRLPQQRTTLNEMRRRVAAILEFIGRTQVDIASEQSDKDELTKYVDDEESKKRIELLFENYTGSLEQMDSLTRKLLSWEQKFGKYGN